MTTIELNTESFTDVDLAVYNEEGVMYYFTGRDLGLVAKGELMENGTMCTNIIRDEGCVPSSFKLKEDSYTFSYAEYNNISIRVFAERARRARKIVYDRKDVFYIKNTLYVPSNLLTLKRLKEYPIMTSNNTTYYKYFFAFSGQIFVRRTFVEHLPLDFSCKANYADGSKCRVGDTKIVHTLVKKQWESVVNLPISFGGYTRIVDAPEKAEMKKLLEEINSTAGTNISLYDFEAIYKRYDIKKR